MTLRILPRLLQAGEPARTASSTLLRLVARSSVRQHVGSGDYFGRVRGAAGFPAALTELLRELKQGRIEVEQLEEVATRLGATDSAFLAKTREIAALQRAVERRLGGLDIRDEDDLVPRALTALQDGAVAALPTHLDVAGLHHFTTAQLALLEALASAGVNVVIHLQNDTERPFLFEPARRTLQRLLHEFHAIAGPELEMDPMPQAPLLAHLERYLFLPGAPRIAADESITLLGAPGDYTEAEMVALRLRRLHDEEGVPWSDCAVVVRSVGENAARMECVMDRFGVPFCASTLEPLGENPAVQFLMRLFQLIPGRWPRDDLLAVLRSSYLGLDLEVADELERLSRREGVHEDPDRWVSLAGRLRRPELSAFLGRMRRWRAEFAEPATARRQVARLRGWAIRCLLGPKNTGESDENPVLKGLLPDVGHRRRIDHLDEKDRGALVMAARVARELEKAREVDVEGDLARNIVRETPEASVEATDFIRELLDLWRSSSYPAPPAGRETVQLLDPYAVSPGEFPVVFIAGLLEGSFPRRIGESAFFCDEERDRLREHGILLEKALEMTDNERMLFYRAVTAARDRIFLSYPRVTGEGKDCLPSFYLDEVRAVVEGVSGRATSRLLAEVAPRPEEAITERDRACAAAVAAGDWRRAPDEEFQQRSAFYARLCAEEPALVARMCDGADRPPPFKLQCAWAPRDRFRSFGVTEIEGFLSCPYQHFASRRLRLHIDPTGPDRLDQGTILHKVVRCYLEELGDDALPGRGIAIGRLEELLDLEIAQLRRDAHPFQLKLLRQSIAILLPAFVDRERQYRDYAFLRPFRFELRFGYEVRDSGEKSDADSVSQPLTITVDGSPPVEIHGRIDRVDRAPDGTAAVIDYKLGKGRTLQEMEAGESLQIPLYFLAMDQVFQMPVAAAFYDCFDRNERLPIVRQEKVTTLLLQPHRANGSMVNTSRFDQMMVMAKSQVVKVADEVEAGRIEAIASDRCGYCDYQDVCRV